MKPSNVPLEDVNKNRQLYPELNQSYSDSPPAPLLPPYQPIAEINAELHQYHQSRLDAIDAPPWQSFNRESSVRRPPPPQNLINATLTTYKGTPMVNNCRMDNMRIITLQKDKNTGQYGLVLLWTMFGIIIFRDRRYSNFLNPDVRTFDRLLYINNEPVTGLKKDEVYRLLCNKSGAELAVIDHPLVRYYDLCRSNTYESLGFFLADGKYIKHVIPYSLASRYGMLENHVILSCNNIETWHQDDCTQLPQILNTSKRIILKTLPIFAFHYYLKSFNELH